MYILHLPQIFKYAEPFVDVNEVGYEAETIVQIAVAEGGIGFAVVVCYHNSFCAMPAKVFP